jgi:hypothetical protein
MFREYAIEPAVISNWERARYFLDAFGPWKGRFLAELPKSWIGEVYKRLQCPPVEKKRIEERLIRLDKRIFSARSPANYDRQKAWLDNALAEHARAPFHGIVANETGDHPHVIAAAAVDELDPRWAMDTGAFVSRNATAIVAAVDLLVACSKALIWIDPYFRASTKARRIVFTDVCRRLPIGTRVSVHLGEPEGLSFEDYRAALTADLAPHLPDCMEVSVRCWSQRTSGERLHNRYLVTDIGGIKFGDSISQGANASEEDHLSLLDEPSRLRLIRSYQDPGDAFDPVGTEFVIRGTGRPRP